MTAPGSRTRLDGFAVDLGGTKIAAARIAGGQLVARHQVATDPDAALHGQIAAMAALLADLGHRPGVPLGVAVTGRLSRDGRWHAVNQGTLGAIAGAPLGTTLQAAFGAARAVNDAAAAAWAEARFGAGQGAENFLYLTASTGVGGGIVLGGRLLESANGLAGHVGFMGSRLGRGLCGSGRAATVEGIAAGRALAAAAAEAGHPGLDARGVFAASAAGEGWAEPLIERSAAALAGLIGDLTAALGLDRVALGGSIGLAPGYIGRVAGHLAAEPALFRPALVTADLGQDSALLGALALAVQDNRQDDRQ
jgi:N-acylmannosamine kinase